MCGMGLIHLILLVYAIVTANDVGWTSLPNCVLALDIFSSTRRIYDDTKTKQRTPYALTYIQDIQSFSEQRSNGSPWSGMDTNVVLP